MGSKNKFNLFTRTISFVLVITFILQDIVYADPELLLKSQTLAQQTLVTDKDKTASFQRYASVYLHAAVSDEPSLGAVERAVNDIKKAADARGLTGVDRPVISGSSVFGVIKITFKSGEGFIFYNPEVEMAENQKFWDPFFPNSEIVVSDIELSNDVKLNRYLRERVVYAKDGPVMALGKKILNTIYKKPELRSRRKLAGARERLKGDIQKGWVDPETLEVLVLAIKGAKQFTWVRRSRKTMASLDSLMGMALRLIGRMEGLVHAPVAPGTPPVTQAPPVLQASPATIKPVRKSESVYKDYFEKMFGFHMDLFVLLARRIKASREKDTAAQKRLDADIAVKVSKINDEIAGFEERLKELPEDVRLIDAHRIAMEEFAKALVEISEKDEIAACACLVGALNGIAEARGELIRRRISLHRNTSINVWREGGKIIIRRYLYSKPDEKSETLMLDHEDEPFDSRWTAARSLDKQEDGELEESEWTAGALARIAEDMEKSVVDPSRLGPENVEFILSGIGDHRRVEEKRLAKIALEAVAELIKLDVRNNIKHLLPIADKYLRLRQGGIEGILNSVEKGRKAPLRNIIVKDNDELLSRIGIVRGHLAKGEYEEAIDNVRGLKVLALAYSEEPEFDGLDDVLWGVISGIEKRMAPAEKKTEAQGLFDFGVPEPEPKTPEDWLDIAERKIANSKKLNRFMGIFRPEYVKNRIEDKWQHPKEEILIKTFTEAFRVFMAEEGLRDGSPEAAAVRMMCYLAVFIPERIEDPANPSSKVANPAFRPMVLLSLIADVDDARDILHIRKMKSFTATSIFFKDSGVKTVSSLDPYRRKELAGAIAADFSLGAADRGKLETALDITADNLRKTFGGMALKSGHSAGRMGRRAGYTNIDIISMASVFFISLSIGIVINFHAGREALALSVLFVGLVYMIGRLAQEMVMDKYLRNVAGFLTRVEDGESFEENKIRDLFIEVIHVYKSPLIQDLVEKRKELLVKLILINVMPPEEEVKSAGPGPVQSIVRSKEARRLIIDEVFASKDPAIFQPGLEAVIEVMARYPKRYFPRVMPLLEGSQKLPRFAEALVDVLIKAEHRRIRLFEIKDELAFFDEVRDAIVELASRSPALRKGVTSYLLKMADKYGKETPLVHDLLDRIGFYVVRAEDFHHTSASLFVETILKIREERKASGDPRKAINVGLTGGVTMKLFFAQLRELLDPDIWKDIHVFQLCEYKGFGRKDPASIAYFLDNNIPVPAGNKHFMDGLAPDMDYIRQISAAGGIDVAVLGLGKNGRVLFNEPGDDTEYVPGRLREVLLSEKAPEDRFAEDPAGYTMSLEDVLKSRHIYLLVEGKTKADIVRDAIFGEVSADIPASRLQGSKNLTVVLDTGALERVARYQDKATGLHGPLKHIAKGALDRSPGAHHVINRAGIIEWVSHDWLKMFGYDSAAEVIGKHIWDLADASNADKARKAVEEKMKTRNEDLPVIERLYRTKSNKAIWVRIREKQILSGSEIVGVQSLVEDISKEKELAAKLDRLRRTFGTTTGKIYRDELTGMRTIDFFRGYYNKRIKKVDHPVSVAVINIEGIKKINADYGADEGDNVIKKVVLLLQPLFQASDVALRYQGGNFILVSPRSSIGDLKRRVNAALEKVRVTDINIGPGNSLRVGIGASFIQVDTKKSFSAFKNSVNDALSGRVGGQSADKAILKNVERVVPLLVNALMNYSRRNDQDRIRLVLDRKIGPTASIRKIINEYVIEELKKVDGNNDILKKALEDLVIIEDDASELPERLKNMIKAAEKRAGVELNKERILIVTAEENRHYFKDFEGSSFITSVENKGFGSAKPGQLDYYPIVEVVFFAVIRALAYDKDKVPEYKDRLWRWYAQIPNIDKLDRARFLELICTGSLPNKTVTLTLKPAAKFDEQELTKIYERIKKVIQSA